MSDATLFDLPDSAVAAFTPALSPDRRRTLRQYQTLASGWHPLGGRLHPQAAPVDDRDAPGRRCGNCWYRRPTFTNGNRDWPKCHVDLTNPTDTNPHPVSLRISHGAATDCRSWWPGCAQHTYGDRSIDPDAARYVPEEVS